MDCKGLGSGNIVISGTLSTFAWKELWKSQSEALQVC